jgi:hypothetical protein
MIFAVSAQADHGVGNGAGGFLCEVEKGANEEFILLDLLETEYDFKFKVVLPDENLPVREQIPLILAPLFVKDPVRYQKYLNESLELLGNIEIVEAKKDNSLQVGRRVEFSIGDLPVTPEWGERFVPEHCSRKVQLITQRAQTVPTDPYYLINGKFWPNAKNRQKAFAITHEAIYGDGIDLGHTIARPSRYFHAKIFSEGFTQQTDNEYIQLLKHLKLKRYITTQEVSIRFDSPMEFSENGELIAASIEPGSYKWKNRDPNSELLWDSQKATFEGLVGTVKLQLTYDQERIFFGNVGEKVRLLLKMEYGAASRRVGVRQPLYSTSDALEMPLSSLRINEIIEGESIVRRQRDHQVEISIGGEITFPSLYLSSVDGPSRMMVSSDGTILSIDERFQFIPNFSPAELASLQDYFACASRMSTKKYRTENNRNILKSVHSELRKNITGPNRLTEIQSAVRRCKSEMRPDRFLGMSEKQYFKRYSNSFHEVVNQFLYRVASNYAETCTGFIAEGRVAISLNFTAGLRAMECTLLNGKVIKTFGPHLGIGLGIGASFFINTYSREKPYDAINARYGARGPAVGAVNIVDYAGEGLNEYIASVGPFQLTEGPNKMEFRPRAGFGLTFGAVGYEVHAKLTFGTKKRNDASLIELTLKGLLKE